MVNQRSTNKSTSDAFIEESKIEKRNAFHFKHGILGRVEELLTDEYTPVKVVLSQVAKEMLAAGAGDVAEKMIRTAVNNNSARKLSLEFTINAFRIRVKEALKEDECRQKLDDMFETTCPLCGFISENTRDLVLRECSKMFTHSLALHDARPNRANDEHFSQDMLNCLRNA